MQGKRAIKGWMNMVLAGLMLARSIPAQTSAPAQTSTPDSSIKQTIVALPLNSKVVVHLKNGTAAQGKVVNRTDAAFLLANRNGGQSQEIAYDQVVSVSQVRTSHAKRNWIIVGAVVAGLAVTAIVVVAKGNGPIFKNGGTL